MMMNKRLLTLVMGLMILFATAVKAEITAVSARLPGPTMPAIPYRGRTDTQR